MNHKKYWESTRVKGAYRQGRTEVIDELVYFVATKLALTHMPADERATFYAELDIKAKEMKEQKNG